MIQKIALFLIGCVLLVSLSACSNNTDSTTSDFSDADFTLSTDPSPAKVNTPLKLVADFIGAQTLGKVEVAFDIRKEDKEGNTLLNAKLEKKGRFTAEKTFTEIGTYTVYIHLMQGDTHITRKKKIQVMD